MWLRRIWTRIRDTVVKKFGEWVDKECPLIEDTFNSEELANLPEECIHTLHFHVSPNNIKLYSEE
jgi:hypothetical protein